MILTLDKFLEFKHSMAEKGIAVHLHDTCGGQYFSLDDAGDETIAAIESFFADKPGIQLVFQPNRLGFFVVAQYHMRPGCAVRFCY